jgi:ribonuclease HI
MLIYLYTDGAAKGNPGRGGYGAILKSGPHMKELSEGFRLTTNNRMELLAVIKGLEAIKTKGSEVLVVSDSKYVVEAVEKGWLWNWIKIGFKNKKNKDLWLRFVNIYRQHTVRFQWIKGHNGHAENERCDQLAVAAAEHKELLIDQAYEDEKNSDQLFDS